MGSVVVDNLDRFHACSGRQVTASMVEGYVGWWIDICESKLQPVSSECASYTVVIDIAPAVPLMAFPPLPCCCSG